jgi:hypothetical protein
VLPVIRRLLVEDAEADRMIVAVTDADGRMLWVEGDRRLRALAEAMHFVGRRAVVRGGRRHQRPGHRAGPRPRRPDLRQRALPAPGAAVELLGRAGAPPGHRRAARAIDVTGGDHVASPQVLTLVRATVAAVESELRWLHREDGPPGRPPAPRPAARPAPRLEVLGRDRARLVCPPPPARRSSRCATPSCCCCSPRRRPEAAGARPSSWPPSAHAGDAAAVTVRAELSRLRRLVGAELLGSRPYRLLGPLETDLARVRGLLDRGAAGAALDATPGRCCPARPRPGVVAARRRTGAALRAAVLRSRRPELLLRWTALPEARDDPAAWQACLEALPARLAPPAPRWPRTCWPCGARPRG